MMWFKRVGILLFIILFFMPKKSFSTVMIRLDIDGLVKNSSVVIEGVVLRKHSYMNKKDGRVYTETKISVRDVIAGECNEKVITIRQIGGEVDGLIYKVLGNAQLNPGERVVLFLNSGKDGMYRITGMAQGKYSIVIDKTKGIEIAKKSLSGISFVTINNNTGIGKVDKDIQKDVEIIPFNELKNRIKEAFNRK